VVHYQCQTCLEGKATDVHHIIPRRMNGLDIPNNLIAQCERCHELLEFIIVRSNQIGVVENLSVIIPLPRTIRIVTKQRVN
jgi:hypothetical protein